MSNFQLSQQCFLCLHLIGCYWICRSTAIKIKLNKNNRKHWVTELVKSESSVSLWISYQKPRGLWWITSRLLKKFCVTSKTFNLLSKVHTADITIVFPEMSTKKATSSALSSFCKKSIKRFSGVFLLRQNVSSSFSASEHPRAHIVPFLAQLIFLSEWKYMYLDTYFAWHYVFICQNRYK